MGQDSYTYSLLIGIISSLVATAIFIFISEVFRRFLIPWLSDKIYQGVRINGCWEDESGDAKFTLKQWGNKITGYYSHKIGEATTSYNVTGTISNMYFMAIAEPKSDKIIDAGVVLLHVEYSDRHLIMKGQLLYKGDPGEVRAWDKMVFKQKAPDHS